MSVHVVDARVAAGRVFDEPLSEETMRLPGI